MGAASARRVFGSGVLGTAHDNASGNAMVGSPQLTIQV